MQFKDMVAFFEGRTEPGLCKRYHKLEEEELAGVEKVGAGVQLTPTGRRGYARRRATVACVVCRGRRSSCDGVRPRRGLCVELEVECVYRGRGCGVDAGDGGGEERRGGGGGGGGGLRVRTRGEGIYAE